MMHHSVDDPYTLFKSFISFETFFYNIFFVMIHSFIHHLLSIVTTSITFTAVMVAALGAAGGLLVAATLKYADSIMKTLAAAGAILLSTVLGHVFLDGPLDVVVCIGGLCTIIAIANYTLDNTPASAIVSSKPPSSMDQGEVKGGGNNA